MENVYKMKNVMYYCKCIINKLNSYLILKNLEIILVSALLYILTTIAYISLNNLALHVP